MNQRYKQLMCAFRKKLIEIKKNNNNEDDDYDEFKLLNTIDEKKILFPFDDYELNIFFNKILMIDTFGKTLENLFIDFLKEKHAYDEYVTSLSKNDRMSDFFYHKTFESLTKEKIEDDYIEDAFLWSSSVSGHEYWSNINYRWKELLHDIYEKIRFKYEYE